MKQLHICLGSYTEISFEILTQGSDYFKIEFGGLSAASLDEETFAKFSCQHHDGKELRSSLADTFKMRLLGCLSPKEAVF